MDPSRMTTIRFAAVAAVLTVLTGPWLAVPSAHAAGPAGDLADSVRPATAAVTAKRAHVTRTFFWMNAMRSTLDRRARETATSRMRTNVAHLRASGTDLGVLAEVTAEQRTDFRRIAGSGWALVGGGNSLDNVVVYRRGAFTRVGHTSMTTRYTGGQRIHVTIPVLRDNRTGTRVAVIAVHNPQWHSGPWREVSLRLEIAKIRQLRRQHRDWRIVIAGDFNAAGSSACGLMRAGLASAAVPRRQCERMHAIDQMYASPQLRPHGYRSVHTSATDHHREYHAKLVF